MNVDIPTVTGRTPAPPWMAKTRKKNHGINYLPLLAQDFAIIHSIYCKRLTELRYCAIPNQDLSSPRTGSGTPNCRWFGLQSPKNTRDEFVFLCLWIGLSLDTSTTKQSLASCKQPRGLYLQTQYNQRYLNKQTNAKQQNLLYSQTTRLQLQP